jgi:WD40 repeat protein
MKISLYIPLAAIFILVMHPYLSLAQGKNYTWLLGPHYSVSSPEGRINFAPSSYSIIGEQRTIPFLETQGNISDENGNLLISSNGYFIADATGDTMLNGSGINPGPCTDDYGPNDGMFLPYGNIILPMPDDTTMYVLFHQTCDYSSPYLTPSVTYYTVIDRSLNGGLGEVVSKNNILLNAMFGAGLAACKHGNGRDWWIIGLSDSTRMVYRFLLTPDTVEFKGTQNLPIPGCWGFAGQPTFSPDGEKFAFASSNGNSTGFWNSMAHLFDFDRCSGSLTLDTLIDFSDGNIGIGAAFSPNSKYLYFSTTQLIYQVNTDTSDIGATFQIVAVNDTFLSAPPVFYTNFYLMYLAANGKIYLTSTNGVLDLHEMNFPDSAGTACDVQLHNINLPCFNVGTVPNHPNYYLGAKTGSPCDTLTNINDPPEHDFRFKVFPNPVMDGNIKIMYLLPQNKSGRLEIYDVTGKVVYSQSLPPWSTIQTISLPDLADGIYNVVVKSAAEWESRKIIVFKE